MAKQIATDLGFCAKDEAWPTRPGSCLELTHDPHSIPNEDDVLSRVRRTRRATGCFRSFPLPAPKCTLGVQSSCWLKPLPPCWDLIVAGPSCERGSRAARGGWDELCLRIDPRALNSHSLAGWISDRPVLAPEAGGDRWDFRVRPGQPRDAPIPTVCGAY